MPSWTRTACPRTTMNKSGNGPRSSKPRSKTQPMCRLACARLCADVISLCRLAGEHGNRNVVSDAGVAVLAAHAALRSAALNVYINAGAIKDEAFVTDRVGELEELLATSATATEEIYEQVKSQL